MSTTAGLGSLLLLSLAFTFTLAFPLALGNAGATDASAARGLRLLLALLVPAAAGAALDAAAAAFRSFCRARLLWLRALAVGAVVEAADMPTSRIMAPLAFSDSFSVLSINTVTSLAFHISSHSAE